MQLFIAFTIVVILSSLFLWNKRPRWRQGFFLLLCLFMTFAYYYLNQI